MARQPHELFNTVMTEFMNAVKQLPLSYDERSNLEEYQTQFDMSVLLQPMCAAQMYFQTMQMCPIPEDPRTYAHYLMLDNYEDTAHFFCTADIPFFKELRFAHWMQQLNRQTKYTIFCYLRNLYHLSTQVIIISTTA